MIRCATIMEQHRLQGGITITLAEQEIGISKGHYCRLMRGAYPQRKTVAKIAEWMGLDSSNWESVKHLYNDQPPN